MRCLLMLLAVLPLAACNDKPPPPKTAFDPHVEALEKARAIEGELREAAARREADAERAIAGSAGSN